MIAVIAHWEVPAVLSAPKAQKKLLMRWNHTLKAFGCHRFILIDVDDDAPYMNDADMKIDVVDTLNDALHLVPDLDPVYVEIEGPPIQTFDHPEDAVYIFGSDFGDLPKATIGIPTHNALHADITCGIILYDRNLKQWH